MRRAVRGPWGRLRVVLVVTVLTLGAVAGFTHLVVGAGTDDAMRFERFDVDVSLDADGRLTITEDLLVRFSAHRRGIERVLPTRGVTRDHPVTIDVLEVTGGPDRLREWDLELPWELEEAEDAVVIAIGGDTGAISPGDLVPYTIRYTISDGLARDASAPETIQLRLDVPGGGWRVPVPEGTVRFDLPTAPSEVACGVGGRGAVSRCPAAEVADTTVVQRWPDLAPFTTATVGVDLPATAVDVTPPAVPLGPLEPAAPVAAIASHGTVVTALSVTGLLAVPVVLYELLRALLLYRDRRTDPLVHDRPAPSGEAAPPDGVGPVDLAHLLEPRPPWELLLAMLLDLENRGIVRSRVEASDALVFNLVDATDADPFEQRIVEVLHPRGRTFTISRQANPRTEDQLKTVQRLIRERATELVAPDGPYGHDRARWLRGTGGRIAAGVTAVGVLLLAWAARDVFQLGAPIVVVSLLALASIVTVVRDQTYPARLPLDSRGRDLQRRAAAFERFIAEVEADRYEWAGDRDQVDADHPALRLLPYAIAFGHGRSWYRRFARYLSRPEDAPAVWWQDHDTLLLATSVSAGATYPEAVTSGGSGSGVSGGSYGGGSFGGVGGGGGSGIGGGGGGSR